MKGKRTLISDDSGRELFRDMVDRGDEQAYTCPLCKKSFTKEMMHREYINSPKEDWMSLAGREGYEYFCPDDGAMVTSEYTRMS